MKFTIFSGCLVQTRFPEYEKSATLVLQSLHLPIEFINNFSCCGSQIVESIDAELLLLLAARNLALAEQKGIDLIITLCGSCTYILKKTKMELQNKNKLVKIQKSLHNNKLDFKNTVKIKHLAEFLNEPEIFQKLKSKLKNKLKLKVALQNPCMLYRPERISQIPKDEELLILNLLKECGVEIVPYEFQDRCCEGTMLAFKKEVGVPLVKNRYEAVNKCNADLFVVGCPNCQLVYNIFPSALDYEIIPSIFFTQILGLALGYSSNEIGLNRNIDNTKIRTLLESTDIDQ
ncbi:MAG TPA: heterodisulfide reductase-related iron-sulfur binding cluster [Candidatus Deferrimicrobium sp.]|nr:heterodisulfide reductase-related iron-sulfur binding cluster [Candidatus Deferrimicrobium sp.]